MREKGGARVLDPQGIVFTESSIGNALATCDLMAHLRDIGINTSSPAVFDKKDRSRFPQALDRFIQQFVRASNRVSIGGHSR